MADLPDPVAQVQRMGSYQGVPAYGCLLTIEAEKRLKVNDPLFAADQLRTYAAAQVAEAVAAERAKWVAEAAEFEQALSRVSQTIDRIGANVETAIRATEAPAARSET
ncbi:hypothetical protein UFOVP707_73 [uncultured Caudovirales phage]|uniref:Uncharacterized protein n=1 Tax=uncultured Caudovirales phage TaxID=2100421 RepID=A0A6J5NPK3_9CAUD|nr:hypothetical protein UFOVP707_73 [uncultured Caudovirales phage]